LWFEIFRLGAWPDYYQNVQFSKDPEALNQFYRQMTPNTGPYDAALNIDAMSKLFDIIGDGVLITHSQIRDVVNANGGDVTLVHLPDIGVYGNTHFPMSDLNNDKIAELMAHWLKEKHLN